MYNFSDAACPYEIISSDASGMYDQIAWFPDTEPDSESDPPPCDDDDEELDFETFIATIGEF